MVNGKIIGAGSFLPNKIMTNFDLEEIVETSDEWIFERSGIRERRMATKDELTSDLALNASLSAINNAGINKDDIDLIIVATTTPDRTFPATATILQNKLEIATGFAFDIQAVCSGFVYALNVADNFIKTGQIKTALVVGAETLTKIVDWSDRTTCVLFGDGAGAVILQSTDEDRGILSCQLHSDGKYGNILNTTGGVSMNQRTGHIYMEGKEVFKLAINKMSDCIINNLKKCNLTIDDIDLFIPHQANIRIIDGVGDKLKLPKEKVITTLEKIGNTSAASIPIAIEYALKNNKIKDGNIVVLDALGGGLTWGSIIIKW
ncbi:MAG: ketoacyl-ACP synthase III [Rickettsiales bacterium]|jgi:3-oxoacyl-[acyl-carrier-protein] synthase-3|nr:ketoacyl-ACP synthase III [Rickettsiales bacterium]